MRVIAFTGSRADYYLQQPLLKRLSSYEAVELKLVVSGTILHEDEMRTLHDIKNDNISILSEIPILELEDDNFHTLQIEV